MLDEHYLISRFSPELQQVILDVQKKTKTPINLIVTSMLGAMSATTQRLADVQRPGGMTSPISLYTFTITGSGERKSTVDQLFTKQIAEWDMAQKSVHEKQETSYQDDMEVWKIKKNLIRSQLKAAIKNDEGIEECKKNLADHSSREPKTPSKRQLIFNDVTPAAMVKNIDEDHGCAALISNDGRSVLEGSALSKVGNINLMWDGQDITVNRVKMKSVTLRHPRLTISLMIQPGAFKGFMSKGNSKYRDSGFFARCLVCQVNSTQGYRIESVDNFSANISEAESYRNFLKIQALLLDQSDQVLNKTRAKRVLKFDQKAVENWVDSFNYIEKSLVGIGEDFTGVKDAASKFAENAARVAAILHIWSGKPSDSISIETMEAGFGIAYYYLHQYRNIFVYDALNKDSLSYGRNEADDSLSQLLAWMATSQYKLPSNLCGHVIVPRTRIAQNLSLSIRDKYKSIIAYGVEKQVLHEFEQGRTKLVSFLLTHAELCGYIQQSPHILGNVAPLPRLLN